MRFGLCVAIECVAQAMLRCVPDRPAHGRMHPRHDQPRRCDQLVPHPRVHAGPMHPRSHVSTHARAHAHLRLHAHSHARRKHACTHVATHPPTHPPTHARTHANTHAGTHAKGLRQDHRLRLQGARMRRDGEPLGRHARARARHGRLGVARGAAFSLDFVRVSSVRTTACARNIATIKGTFARHGMNRSDVNGCS